MEIVAIIIGLICSVAAFGTAVWGIQKMTQRHEDYPSMSDAKFFMIRKTLLSLVIATVIFYASFIGAGAYVYLQSNTTHQALCALRSNRQQNVRASQRFLLTHPKGIPGIPRKLIFQGMERERETIHSLDNLRC